MGFFPADIETINFLRFTGRSEEQVALVETYLKEQGLFHTAETPQPEFSDVIELNLDSVEPKLFGIGSESYVAGSHEFYLHRKACRKFNFSFHLPLKLFHDQRQISLKVDIFNS